jgi:hypothetical protein
MSLITSTKPTQTIESCTDLVAGTDIPRRRRADSGAAADGAVTPTKSRQWKRPFTRNQVRSSVSFVVFRVR